MLLYIQRKEVDVKNPDFNISISPRPVKVTGKYEKGITVIGIKGLGLNLTIRLKGNYTEGLALEKVREAILRLSDRGRLHLAPTHLVLVIQQLP